MGWSEIMQSLSTAVRHGDDQIRCVRTRPRTQTAAEPGTDKDRVGVVRNLFPGRGCFLHRHCLPGCTSVDAHKIECFRATSFFCTGEELLVLPNRGLSGTVSPLPEQSSSHRQGRVTPPLFTNPSAHSIHWTAPLRSNLWMSSKRPTT